MDLFLQQVDMDHNLSSTDVEFIWSSLKGLSHHAISLYVPKFRSRGHMYPKWFTPSLCHSLHKLHSLRRKARDSTSPHHKSAIAIAESNFESMVMECKSMVNAYDSSNCPKIFNYLHSLSKESLTPSSIFYESKSASEDRNKAELFNEFFQSVFKPSRISFPDPKSLPIPAGHPVLKSIAHSEQDVHKALISLDPSKATGPDQIPARVLKLCSYSLTEPIHHLFKTCLHQSYIPFEWRTH